MYTKNTATKKKFLANQPTFQKIKVLIFGLKDLPKWGFHKPLNDHEARPIVLAGGYAVVTLEAGGSC